MSMLDKIKKNFSKEQFISGAYFCYIVSFGFLRDAYQARHWAGLYLYGKILMCVSFLFFGIMVNINKHRVDNGKTGFSVKILWIILSVLGILLVAHFFIPRPFTYRPPDV